MKHEGSVALFQYWDRLREGRPAPQRTEIEPADIRTLLADTFILESDTRSEAIFRLAGTRLCAVFGRELKGFAFASIWTERDQRIVSRLIGNAFQQKAVVVIELMGFSRNGRENGFELLLLPLEGGRDHPRALGSLVALDKPYWLGADPIISCRVEAVRIVDPDREPVFLKNRPSMAVPSLAPDRDALMPLKSARKIRHLVVIDGGKDD